MRLSQYLTPTLALTTSVVAAAVDRPRIHDRRQVVTNVTYTDRDGNTVPQFTMEELFSMTTDFLEAFIWPADQKQIDSINSTLFSENVTGRVDVTGNFDGRQLNTEYIFGLFAGIHNNPDPNFFTLLGTPMKYDLVHWAGLGNVVSFANINYLQVPAVNLTVPFEVDVWLTFDENRQISQYDATFRYLQWAFDTMMDVGMVQHKITDTGLFQNAIAMKLATSICSAASSSCNGTNTQYESTEECMNFLTKEIRFGKAYEMGSNTLLCRMVHQGMVPLAPDVHCNHIGKDPKDYCTDKRAYLDTVMGRVFTPSSFNAASWARQSVHDVP